jgi:hypothetical protein
MSKWTLDTPPTWVTNATATESGWIDATTGELLVAIRGLATRRTTGATAVSASFATTSSKTKLKTADVITLTVKFNEKVTVTGSPQLSVTIGGNTRQATYASGTGTNSLVFTYAIIGGDSGSWTAIGASITLNSGTMKDTNDGTTNAVLTGVGALFASTSAYSVDNTAPTVGDVVIYGGAKFTTGNVIRFKVPFSEAVTVTGTPLLDFDINTVDRTAAYVETSASGTDVFFEYTVVGGDSCIATEFDLTGTITLSGGTILNASGISAPVTGLAAEAFIDTIFVNTGAAAGSATVSTVTCAASTYGIGEVLPIVVTFSQRVQVTGTPQFTFLLDGVETIADYASGEGTTALTFNYTIVSGNLAADGDVTYAANPLSLNDGTITNYSGTAVTLTKTGASFASVIIDGSIPVVDSSAFTGAAHPSYVTGDDLEITLTFDENVTVTGNPIIPVGIGAYSRELVYASGTGTTDLVFTYEVVAGDVAAIPGQGFTIANDIDLDGGTIVDAAGNSANLRFRRPAITLMTFNG